MSYFKIGTNAQYQNSNKNNYLEFFINIINFKEKIYRRIMTSAIVFYEWRSNFMSGFFGHITISAKKFVIEKIKTATTTPQKQFLLVVH